MYFILLFYHSTMGTQEVFIRLFFLRCSFRSLSLQDFPYCTTKILLKKCNFFSTFSILKAIFIYRGAKNTLSHLEDLESRISE